MTKLAAAQGMIAEHRFDEAREALRSIPPESLLSDQAAELLKGLDAKHVDFVAGSANAKLQAGDLAGAREALPELMRLDAVRGDELAKGIDAAQAALDREALKGAKNRKQREKLARDLKKRKADDAVRGELMAGYRKFQEAGSPGGYDRAANEFDRIANDLRVSPDELDELVRHGPHAADELPKLLKVLGIEEADLAAAQPLLLRDMERVCALCIQKRQCDHDLADGTIAGHYRDYCLNAPSIDQIGSEAKASEKAG